jgi:hypothetical protein
MFQRFVTAMNTVSSQYIALLTLLIGCAMMIIAKRYSVEGSVGAGIIGAAINMLTHDPNKLPDKPASKTTTTIDSATPSITQTTTTDGTSNTITPTPAQVGDIYPMREKEPKNV